MRNYLKIGLFNCIIFYLVVYLIYKTCDFLILLGLLFCLFLPILFLLGIMESYACSTIPDDVISFEITLISLFPPFFIVFYYFKIKDYKTNKKHIIANFNIMQTLCMIEDDKEFCEDGILCVIKDKPGGYYFYPKIYEIYLIPDSIITYFKFNRWYKQYNKMKKKEEKIKAINKNGSSEYYEILKQDLEKYKNEQEKKASSLIEEAQNNFEKMLSE